MKAVKNNLKKLEYLCKCTNKQSRTLIENENKKFIQCICECVLNCLNGNIHLLKDEKTKLQKFKNNLRDLVKSRQSLKNQRKILI